MNETQNINNTTPLTTTLPHDTLVLDQAVTNTATYGPYPGYSGNPGQNDQGASTQRPDIADASAGNAAHPYPTQSTPSAGNGDAFAVTSFVLGIVSVLSGYFFVTPILGLVFGVMAKRRPNTMPALVNWGIGINAVILGFWALIAGIFVTIAFFAIVGGLFWS